jgi:hypothetical protein
MLSFTKFSQSLKKTFAAFLNNWNILLSLVPRGHQTCKDDATTIILTAFSIMSLSLMGLYAILSINDSQEIILQSAVLLSVAFLICYAEGLNWNDIDSTREY